jgi:hypothetical protein
MSRKQKGPRKGKREERREERSEKREVRREKREERREKREERREKREERREKREERREKRGERREERGELDLKSKKRVRVMFTILKFPLDGMSAVCYCSATINGTTIVAEVKEKEEAKASYDGM